MEADMQVGSRQNKGRGKQRLETAGVFQKHHDFQNILGKGTGNGPEHRGNQFPSSRLYFFSLAQPSSICKWLQLTHAVCFLIAQRRTVCKLYFLPGTHSPAPIPSLGASQPEGKGLSAHAQRCCFHCEMHTCTRDKTWGKEGVLKLSPHAPVGEGTVLDF